MMNEDTMKKATLAGGCFWCTEAVFQRLEGVEEVLSGFTGGTIKNPAYREIITGRTGHAEAIQISYDEDKISFKDLLLVFFATHDPTTLNRQQNDVGTQYRSAKFINYYLRSELMSFKNSFLVSISLNCPLKPDVVVALFCFCTPRIIIHICTASITTATP